MWKLALIVGVGIGYVLGARAGRERYEQIAGKTRRMARDPRVQRAADRARQQAGRTANAMAGKVGDHLPDAVTERVPYFQRQHAGSDGWGTSLG